MQFLSPCHPNNADDHADDRENGKNDEKNKRSGVTVKTKQRGIFSADDQQVLPGIRREVGQDHRSNAAEQSPQWFFSNKQHPHRINAMSAIHPNRMVAISRSSLVFLLILPYFPVSINVKFVPGLIFGANSMTGLHFGEFPV